MAIPDLCKFAKAHNKPRHGAPENHPPGKTTQSDERKKANHEYGGTGFVAKSVGGLRRFARFCLRILRLRNTRLKAFSIQDFELLDTQKQVRLLVFVANLFRYAFMLLQLLLTVPMLFAIFPQTKNLAYQLFFYIWDPVKSILYGILAYIPNLFTIFVICLAIKYLVRLFRYLAGEVQSERLKLNGFYPDWAMPTYHIIRFLLYAFMVAMIYPYLPGADSGVFQGISVFVGLIVSLGSSTVIGNIIAGLVITYMRPFKLGDRIQLNETTGNVVEKTPLVTRIRTPKNEVVTIPNSFIMSPHYMAMRDGNDPAMPKDDLSGKSKKK